MDKRGRVGLKHLVFLVYLFFGIWFMNEPFQIFPLFEITEWMMAIAGVMLIIAGFTVVLTFRKPGMGMPVAGTSAPKNINVNLQRKKIARSRRAMVRRR